MPRQDRVDGPERAVPPERTVAGEHFVEHSTEREDVAALVRGASANLLGRHVSGGAEEKTV